MAALLGGALGAAAGCGDTDAEARKVAELSEGCTINTDCRAPMKCAFRRCHTECNTSRDCPLGQTCVASDRPFHVCQLDDERDCTRNSDCPAPMICALDGQCRDQCSTERDCVLGQQCVSGSCADPEDTADGGLIVPDGGADGGGVPVGTPCTYHSECPDGLWCLSGVCRAECLADRDCAAGRVCAGGRCEVPATDGGADGGGDASVECTFASECVAAGTGAACVGGRCVPECLADLDCGAGRRCAAGRCAVDAPDGAPDGFGAGCALNSDCAAGLVCRADGSCGFECVTRADCAAGQCCSAVNTCVAGPCEADAGTPDAAPVDAGVEAGPPCSGATECQDGDLCNGYERCLRGFCYPALEATCEDENPCTLDRCTAATGACEHLPLGPQDADQDGHFDVGCGGTADDCDDRDGAVHPGHAELCDQKDNNCDGRVDEGAWKAGVVTTLANHNAIPHPGASSVPYRLGPPVVARLPDGTFLVASAAEGAVGLRTWRLDASLAVVEGPTEVLLPPQNYAALPALAAGPGGFALAAFDPGTGGCGVGRTSLRVSAGTQLASLAAAEVFGAPFCGDIIGGPLPSTSLSLAPSGAGYVAAWADVRDGAARVWLSTLSQSGALGGVRLPLPDAAEAAVGAGLSSAMYQPRIAAGPQSALVAWQGLIGGLWTLRTVVLDAQLGAVLAGPRDFALPGNYPGGLGVAHTGQSFLVVSATLGQGAATAYRLDELTGALLSQTDLPSPAADADPRVAAVGGGWFVTLASGTAGVSYGWVPEAVGPAGFTLAGVYSAGNVASTANAAAIDAKSAVVVWQDGNVKAVRVECGP